MTDLEDTARAAMAAREDGNAPPPRPSLLPPFDFPSSSPGLPRATKRKFDDILEDRRYYPTPVPTSSTGLLPSSPPSLSTRPGLQRTVSTLSERAPLGDVPTLDLPANGEPLLMGRSSNSSDYQLANNRHISRVHVRASYYPPDVGIPAGRVEVECLGWNGCKVHCRGVIKELNKGEVFESCRPMAQILVDVQETRVMLVWPKEESREPSVVGSRSPWALESPTKQRRTTSAPYFMPSSPPIMLPPRPASPVSPTPAVSGLGNTFTSTFRADSDGPVQVYEDHSSDEDAPGDVTQELAATGPLTKRSVSAPQPHQSHSTTASEEPERFSEHNEENDPIVHSFYAGGDNILDRFQSIHSRSPERIRKPRKPLKASTNNSPGRSDFSTTHPLPIAELNNSPVKNHVINQLAFSRIHSLPLSTILSNLPAELGGAMAKPSDTEPRKALTTSDLKTILNRIPCVGEISRQGKDAAGKLLESQFYYVPENDQDEMRKETVMQSLGKTSIRAARKQHKQYYWKRPRH